jgi:hypothetical protein
MNLGRAATPALLAIVLLTGCRHAAPPTDHLQTSAQGSGFVVDYDPAAFGKEFRITEEPRLTAAENGTDIPLDVGPARTKISFAPIPPAFLTEGERWGSEGAWIRIVPLQDSGVPDFQKAYPNLARDAAELRSLLGNGRFVPGVSGNLPDFNCVDCAQTIHAKFQRIDTPWCSGIQYVTTCVQEAAQIGNPDLEFTFVGLSKDGRYYIVGHVPLAQPSLPVPGPDLTSADEARVKDYYLQAEQKVNALADDTFSPPLGTLREMIQSIRPEAPQK